MAYDETTAARVRQALSGRAVEEKRMMGGLVFMVGGHMCCGLSRGSLMVRVGVAAKDRALTEPHTRPMEMGGRSPAGFIYVAPEGFATDADLAKWVGLGLAFVATLPPKDAKPGPSRRPGSRSSGGSR